MPLDPSIAMGVKPIQIADPLAQYGQLAAIQNAQNQSRAAENQNALAQYTIAKARRDDTATEAMNELYSKHYNPTTGAVNQNALFQDLAARNLGSKIPDIQAKLLETQGKRATVAKDESDVIDAKLKQSRQFLDTINPTDPNAPAAYLAWHRANHADPVLGPVLAARGVTADQSLARINQAIEQGPQAFANLLNQSKLGTEKFMELNKPTITAQTTGAETRLLATPGLGGTTTVVPGSTAAVTMNEYQKNQVESDRKRLGLEGQRVGLEQRRVQIQEEQDKREQDPAFQQKMAQAKATGIAIAKDNALAAQVLPKVLDTAETTLSLIDSLVGKAPVVDKNGRVIKSGTKPHPGFETAVGASVLPGARFVPGTDASDFQSRFDQIKGGAFLTAFETLKGGGSITNIEGEKGTAALNRMNLAQSEKEFTSAAREFQDIVRKGVERAKTRVGGGTSTVGKDNAVDTSNPLLK